MHYKKIRFVHLLTTFVSLAIVTTMIVQLIVSFIESNRSLYETTLKLNFENAVNLSETMNSVFQSMENTLVGYAKHISEQMEIDNDPQRHINHFMDSNNFFNTLIMVDPSGIVQAASSTHSALIRKKWSVEPAQTALNLHSPYLSKPFRLSEGHTLILMSQPIFGQHGDYLGYLAGTIQLDQPNILHDIFNKKAIRETGSYIYVVDASGHILFHPEPERLGEQVSANPIVQKLTEGMNGYDEVTNTIGQHFLAGFATISENGWGIVVQSPVEEIRKQAYQIVMKQMQITLPFFIALLVLTFLLARKLAAPFSILAESANISGMDST